MQRHTLHQGEMSFSFIFVSNDANKELKSTMIQLWSAVVILL